MRSLANRVALLEGAEPDASFGAAILLRWGEGSHDACRRYEAQYGPIVGEPVLIRLVGVVPRHGAS